MAVIDLTRFDYPATAQMGAPVNLQIQVKNVDPWGEMQYLGVSVLDQLGVPIVLWNLDLMYGSMYESPIVYAMVAMQTTYTFYGSYIQNDGINYPLNLYLHHKSANDPGAVWQTPYYAEFSVLPYSPTYANLDMAVAGGVGGTVYADNSSYPLGTYARITAMPAAGYKFSRWDILMAGVHQTNYNNPHSLLMTTDALATAYFVKTTTPTEPNVSQFIVPALLIGAGAILILRSR